MATEFKVNRGNESIIKDVTKVPITSGTLSLTEDGQNIYLDSNDGSKRIHITDVIDLSINDPKVYYPNKIYISGTQLKFWNNTTQTLDVISDLENIPIESNNAFIYDENDSHKATIIDSNSPNLGTIIFDKNGDCGIVTKVDGETIYVSILSNPATSEVLTGRDIYFDSTYTGIQVGTINKPFNNWTNLFNNCKGELQDKIPTTIHLLSNSILSIDSIIENLNDVTFVGSSNNEVIQFTKEVNFDNEEYHFGNSSNIIFKDLILKANETNDSFLIFENSNVNYYNCVLCPNDKFGISFGSCNLYINNCKISDLGIASKNNINVTLIHSEIDNIDNSKHNNEDAYKTINIIDCTINDTLDLFGLNDIVNIIDTIFIKNGPSVLANIINLNGGLLKNDTPEVTTYLDGNQVTLGTFNFNGTEVEVYNNANSVSGLNSKQVYDKTERNYGNKNETLESHLDAIDEMLNNLSNNTSETDNPSVNKLHSFTSKFAFNEYDNISTNVVYSVGDVIKYTGLNDINLKSYWNKLPIDIIEFNTDNAIGKGKINGAQYLLKVNDLIYINYNDVEYEAIPLLSDITTKGIFTFTLKNKDDAVNLESFTNSDAEIKEKYSNSYYVSNMIINPNDRLLCVAMVDDIPIWDKLSNTSEDIDATTLVGKEVTDFAFSGTYESLNESIPTNNAIYTITTNEISGTEDTFMIMWSENAKLAVSKNTNKIYRNDYSGTSWIEIGNDLASTGTYNSLDDIPNKSGLYVVRTNDIPSTSDVYANYSIVKLYSEYGSTILALSDLGQIYIKNNDDESWNLSSDDTPKSIADGGCRLKYIRRQEIPDERLPFVPTDGNFLGECNGKYYSYFVEPNTEPIKIKYHESKNDSSGTLMTISDSSSFPRAGTYYTVAIDSDNGLIYIVAHTSTSDPWTLTIYKYSISHNGDTVTLLSTNSITKTDTNLHGNLVKTNNSSLAFNNKLYFVVTDDASSNGNSNHVSLICMDESNTESVFSVLHSSLAYNAPGILYYDGISLYWMISLARSSDYNNQLYKYNVDDNTYSTLALSSLKITDEDFDSINNLFIYTVVDKSWSSPRYYKYIKNLNSNSADILVAQQSDEDILHYKMSINGYIMYVASSNYYSISIIKIVNINNGNIDFADNYSGKNFGIILEDKYIYVDQGDGTELVYAII